MRLGLSTWSFPWAIGVPGSKPERPLSAIGVLRGAVDRGVQLVQFADNLPLDELTAAEYAAFVSEARGRGVSIELGTRGLTPRLGWYLEAAVELGSPFVRVVVDLGNDEPSPDEVVDRLRAWEGPFRDADRLLAIENHDRFSTGQLLDILDRLGDWVGICLDTVNSLGAGQSAREVVGDLGPRAINLHVKDYSVRRHPHQMGFEVIGTPAGAGMLDVPWLMSSLTESSRVETAILELWVPPAQTIDQTIEREVAWVDQSLGYLLDTGLFER